MAETLKMAFTIVNNTSNETDVLAVVDDHTYTVMSISICERAGAAEAFNLFIRDDAGSTDYYIYDSQSLPAAATFIHNDKLILLKTDVLSIQFDSAATAHVVISYLDQDD